MASGETLAVFGPLNHEPPSSNPATQDLRNYHRVLDMALNEIAIFSFVLPRHYGGNGITIYLHYAMSTATANDIELNTYFERIGDQQQDLDADGWQGPQVSAETTVPSTSGLVDIITTTHANAQLDGLIVGDSGRLKVVRVAVSGTDATGDLELLAVELKET
jgi:hypothetical protein